MIRFLLSIKSCKKLVYGCVLININAGKSKVMIFYPRGKTVDPNLIFVFDNKYLNCSINTDLIHPVERIKILVLVLLIKSLVFLFEENLTFDYHVKYTQNKISKSLFTLNTVKNSLSSTALKSLYYALIHPYFLYCLPVISCSSPKNINMLALNKSGVFVLFVRLVTMLILEASVSFIKNPTSC